MKNMKLLLPVLIMIFSIPPNWNFFAHQNDYKVHFVNVGQGDAIIFRTPTNCTAVIDGGNPNLLTDQLSKYLPSTEKDIDLIVLTHPHLDHLGGVIQLLNRYTVKNVFTTGVEYQSAFYKEFNRLVAETETNSHFVQSGEEYYLCGLTINVIYPIDPFIGEEIENINNASIVLKIGVEDKWIYLSGDAENEVEEEILLSEADVESYIMKAGHHGSNTSNSQQILSEIAPEYFIIQTGENSYGHPHLETLLKAEEIGAKIYRTDKSGTITFFF